MSHEARLGCLSSHQSFSFDDTHEKVTCRKAVESNFLHTHSPDLDTQPSSMDVPGSFCFRAINPDPNFDELEKLLQPYGGVVLRLLVPEPEAEQGEGKWKMLVKFRTKVPRTALYNSSM